MLVAFLFSQIPPAAYTDRRDFERIIAESGESMSLIVQKFGGSSVRDTERLYHVAKRIARSFRQGNQVVVVVSAQGKTTDRLVEKAKEVSPAPSPREMDVLLSSGEQMSISLLAMALHRLNCPAVSLCGWQVGIRTNGNHQNARIQQVETERIRQLLEQGMVVIVAGFQGVDEKGDITTLGRGGSDTTAVALAAALQADRCQIFTDVEGVYTADPRIVEGAIKWQEISYNDMLVMASMGAKVLHDRSVELAKEKRLCLEVLSSLTDMPGTLLCHKKENLPALCSITADGESLRYFLPDVSLEDAGRLMTELYRQELRPDLCSQPADGQLQFTISAHQKHHVQKVMANLGLSAELEEQWAKISMVGCGMHSIPNLKQELMDVLEEAHIPQENPWIGERRCSVLVPKEQKDEALRAFHSVLLRHLSL